MSALPSCLGPERSWCSQVCQCQVGLFCSLLGPFCLYIRPLLTPVHTQMPLRPSADGSSFYQNNKRRIVLYENNSAWPPKVHLSQRCGARRDEARTSVHGRGHVVLFQKLVPQKKIWATVFILKVTGQAPYGTKSACAKRAAYPETPPAVPHPESLAAHTESLYRFLPRLLAQAQIVSRHWGPSLLQGHIVNRGTQ
jgi:hypothetical protein